MNYNIEYSSILIFISFYSCTDVYVGLYKSPGVENTTRKTINLAEAINPTPS